MSDNSYRIHAPSAWRGFAESSNEGCENGPAEHVRRGGLVAEAGKQAATLSRNAARELRDHPLETAAILAAAAAAIAIAMAPRSKQSPDIP